MAKTRRLDSLPEGGWGWMVTLGMVIMFIATTGQYTAFGLLFGGILDKLDAKTTGATVIMNALAASVNFTGLVTHCLLKTTSYRVLAIVGGLMFSAGVLLTVFTQSIVQIVITYSIIAGIGLGLIAPASYLAFNSYFSERRDIAMGICQAGIGLGFMAAPPLCQYLLEHYSFQGTMLILGGISLNSVVGAMLYQPVKRHIGRPQRLRHPREQNDGMEEIPLGVDYSNDINILGVRDPNLAMTVIPEEEDDLRSTQPSKSVRNPKDFDQINSQDTECEEHTIISRRGSLVMSAVLEYRSHRFLSYDGQSVGHGSTVGIVGDSENVDQFQKRPVSASLANFSSNLLMFDNSMTVPDTYQNENNASSAQRKKQSILKHSCSDVRGSLLEPTLDDLSDYITHSDEDEKEMNSHLCQCLLRLVRKQLDWDLLSDILYWNIVFGLALSFVSDSNFFTIFPFFMVSLGFSGSQIALCITIISGADIVARLLLPWVSKLCHLRPRTAYLLGCLSSAITRSILVSTTGDFLSFASMSGLVGFLKGAMVVNLSLSISQHCSVEKFGAAYSFFMVVTGVVTLTVGSFLGLLTDMTGSFPLCIHILSVGLILCPIAWLLEMIFTSRLKRRFFL